MIWPTGYRVRKRNDSTTETPPKGRAERQSASRTVNLQEKELPSCIQPQPKDYLIARSAPGNAGECHSHKNRRSSHTEAVAGSHVETTNCRNSSTRNMFIERMDDTESLLYRPPTWEATAVKRRQSSRVCLRARQRTKSYSLAELQVDLKSGRMFFQKFPADPKANWSSQLGSFQLAKTRSRIIPH